MIRILLLCALLARPSISDQIAALNAQWQIAAARDDLKTERAIDRRIVELSRRL